MYRMSTEKIVINHYRWLLLMGVACGSYFIIIINTSDGGINVPSKFNSYNRDYSNAVTANQTSGCHIPNIKIMDDSIKKFVAYPKSVKACRSSNSTLLGYNNSTIYIKKGNLHHYHIVNETHLHCCYEAFYRPANIDNIFTQGTAIDDRVKYKACVKFNDSIAVKDDFVRVTCYNIKSKIVYRQFYISATKKISIDHGYKKNIKTNKNSYNILILGIDAVSRMNFYRTMPKTIKFFTDYGAVDLAGYNKVGDNTFPNLIPLLMGLKYTEITQTCRPYPTAHFDFCPFVWESYKAAGYYTAFLEDASRLGTFNYNNRRGFIKEPTDYYIRNFIKEAEKEFGYTKCFNDKYLYQILLNYTLDLAMLLKNDKLFGIFWEATLSHDNLNYPMLMDDSYLNFFKSLAQLNYFNNTLIFLMSDHGIRFGNIRKTKQGWFEERLPFMFILAPSSFREKYSEAYNNLKTNSQRLTTPFDIHETLKDLVDLRNIENDIVENRTATFYSHNRGISLFLPIPRNRTCAMAGIDDHWCTCLKETPVSTQSTEAIAAVDDLLAYLNSLLLSYPQCAILQLSQVREVAVIETENDGRWRLLQPLRNGPKWRLLRLTIQTSPGGAWFEGTLGWDAASSQWKPEGTVSRINRYGDDSYCIDDPELKLYCHCKHKASTTKLKN